jgi:hypothetical protein
MRVWGTKRQASDGLLHVEGSGLVFSGEDSISNIGPPAYQGEAW